MALEEATLAGRGGDAGRATCAFRDGGGTLVRSALVASVRYKYMRIVPLYSVVMDYL